MKLALLAMAILMTGVTYADTTPDLITTVGLPKASPKPLPAPTPTNPK